MALTQTQVSQLYVSIFGRASEGSGNTYWQSAQSSMTAAAAAMLATDAAKDYFGATLNNNQAFIEFIYNNTLGKTLADDPAGIAYWVSELAAGKSKAEVVATLIVAAQDPANAGTAQTQFNNKVAVSNYTADHINAFTDYAKFVAFIDDVDATNASVVEGKAEVDAVVAQDTGKAFYLTANQDGITGTTGNDTIYADVVQVGGPQVNSLATGDSINAGAGTDSMEAQITTGLFMGGTNMPIQPRITSVEDIKLEALNSDMYSEVENNLNPNSEVYFNGKNTYGVDAIRSWYSDANLTVQDLNTMTSAGDHDVARNTSEMTIGMGYTGSNDHNWDESDMHVFFDEDFLLTGQQSQSQAVFFLLDQDADLLNTDVDADGTEDLLANINVNGLLFSVNGQTFAIEFDKALLTSNDVITHADFVAALQPALAALIASGSVPADTVLRLDPSMTDFTFLDDGSRSSDIPAILLETHTSTVLTPVGFKWVSDLVGEYNVYGRYNDDAEVTPEPLSVQIELEKVGRGGDGGELIVGSMDKDHSGINDFYVTVKGDAATGSANGRPSSLSRLDSTGNALDRIFITSDNDGFPGDTYADLTIGNTNTGLNPFNLDDSPVNDGMTLIQSVGFMGNLSLGTLVARVDDLKTLDTTDMAGTTTFFAEIDAKNLYEYKTGSGNDIISLELDGDGVDTIYTGLSIATNAGNDIILVNDSVDLIQTGVSQRTMLELNNLLINSGTGDDYVELGNNFRFNINAGAGSDMVYIDSADLSLGTGTTGAWNISTLTGPATFIDRVLYQAELTVTFAGFESTVSVETDAAGNFVADQMDINAAIKAAIAANPELARLLTCIDGTGDQNMTIVSLVDGANELSIDLYQPELVVAGGVVVGGQVNLAAADVTSLLKGIIATVPAESSLTDPLTYVNANDGSLNANGTVGVGGLWDGDAVDLDNQFMNAVNGGTNATTVANINYSVINMGNGTNDLLVLDSNDDSANILVIDQTFGKVSVVNFFDDAELNIVGNHAVDYTKYLSNKIDLSVNVPANTLSADPIAVTLDTVLDPTIAATIDANEVKMIRLVETATETFAGLTASALVTALNGDNTAVDNYANINNTINAAATTANLVGNVQNHIFMVENANNLGEYKVFYLTSTIDATTATTAGEFDTTAVMLGTLDFGDSINFRLVGDATWATDYAAWHALADGAAVVVNTPPVAVDDALTATATVPANLLVLANDHDANGDTIVFDTTNAIVVSGVGATATYDTVNKDINFTATTAGTYTFDYAIKDGNGGTDTATATVTVAAAGGSTTKAVDATTAAAALSAAGSNVTYTIAQATYTQEITNFAAGDVLDFPAGNTPTVNNTSYTDGIVDVVFANAGTVTTIHLTGLAAATDIALNGVTDFNTLFGAGTIA